MDFRIIGVIGLFLVIFFTNLDDRIYRENQIKVKNNFFINYLLGYFVVKRKYVSLRSIIALSCNLIALISFTVALSINDLDYAISLFFLVYMVSIIILVIVSILVSLIWKKDI